jgi:hypothetical protein
VSDKKPPALLQGGETSTPSQSLTGCLTRIAWSFCGIAVALILWVTILRGPPWALTIGDALYWTVVLGMIAARYLDVARYDGLTLSGEPATRRDAQRYAVGVLAASGLAWGVAQTFQV